MERIFIIAELSANHNGSFETALKTVKAAKEIGADAIKIQTYTADTITLDCKKADFRISNGGLWDGYYLYDLYKEAYTPWEWHAEIFKLAKEEGIICFSSPFDKTAIDFLEELNNPIYKIASFEITDIPLIKYAASKGKPMIISTGIASEEDIQLAVKTCREEGNNDITLLKCTSAYPAPIEEANLIMIRDLAERFGVKVGLSDHSLGITLPITAVALGATVIEKHFILDKSIGGPDAAFSLDKKEFAQMIKAVREVEQAIGKIDYNLSEKQKVSREHSRSLYVVSNIKAGEKFTDKNIRSIRPGFGLHPKYYWEVIGKIAKKDIQSGTALSTDLFI
jgi:pseudaminic acid synthase